MAKERATAPRAAELQTAAPPPTRPTERIVTSPPEVVPTIPLPGLKVMETEHFAFYADNGYRPVNFESFAEVAERIYDEMSLGLGAESPETMILSFRPPEDIPCPARGMTLFAEPGPRITIFADERTREEQILGVLAHELVHVIHHTGFSRPLGGDPGLSEGVATWFSRGYWTAWLQSGSIDEMVGNYLATGDYIPLAEADIFSVHPVTTDDNLAVPEDDNPTNCLAQRDLIYSEWAAFVGYLLNTYGWEQFEDLMASAASEVTDEGVILPSPTDYEGVYGKTLETLEAEWLTHIQAGQ